MIDMREIRKSYPLNKDNEVAAVRGITLEVRRGEFVVITGRSGSGKTTLLNLAAGLTRPTAGTVSIDGVDLWDMADDARSALRNEKMGFVFQFPSLLPSLTVLENVLLPGTFGANPEPAGNVARARRLLEQVGIPEKWSSLPRQLSAGQQQRVVVARALINRPAILFADEPTSDLDEQTETEIMELFSQIHEDAGITIMLVTHSSQLVSYGTRALQMAGGLFAEASERGVAGGSPTRQ